MTASRLSGGHGEPPHCVCLCSGPRNVSTALMYSFAQRSDTSVVDEPLYGHYLRVSKADHPGRDAVMASMNCDGASVMSSLLSNGRPSDKPILFLKQMAHHFVDLDLTFLDRCANVFLIRDPRDMLPSLTVQLPGATLKDTGLKKQWELFERFRAAGTASVVLDSRLLLNDPAEVLRELCGRLAIAYDPGMLSWPPGPRDEDGVWAEYWYDAVHRSSGFQPYRAKGDFPVELKDLLRDCQPYYDGLFQHAIGVNKT